MSSKQKRPQWTSGQVWRFFYRSIKSVTDCRHRLFGLYLSLTVPVAQSKDALPELRRKSRILILRLDDIGDFVCTVPFLRAIRSLYPQSHLTLLANETVRGLAEPCPYIDDFMGYSMERRGLPFDQVSAYVNAVRFARRTLAGRNYEYAIIPRIDIDNGCALAMAFHAKIPVRVGYSESTYPLKQIKNADYHRLLTHCVPVAAGRHEVQTSAQVARYLGARVDDLTLELWASADDRSALKDLILPFRRLKGGSLIAISPGANLDRRQWPEENFASLAYMLVKNHDVQVVIVGGPNDAALGDRIIARSGLSFIDIVNLAGKTALRQTIALLELSDLFIGNDSGPLHMAAAAKIPCVEISCHPVNGSLEHANSPARYSPWNVLHTILQPQAGIDPCIDACLKDHAHCITLITADAVLEASMRLLRQLER